jgi:succinate dehydrogenase hydrophobic anchor subunit
MIKFLISLMAFALATCLVSGLWVVIGDLSTPDKLILPEKAFLIAFGVACYSIAGIVAFASFALEKKDE